MTEHVVMGMNAYLDGEIGPEEAAEIEAQLDSDHEARVQFEAFLQHKTLLGEAVDALNCNPHSLETARLERRLATAIHWRSKPRKVIPFSALRRMGSQVAVTLAFVALGWWGHATLSSQERALPNDLSQAVGTHLMFADDRMHPLEFSGGAIDGAAPWFSEEFGVSIDAPDLSGQGMILVGSRLLGTKEGPLAQFIYENINTGRYSLTLRWRPANQPISPLRLAEYPNQAAGYWSTSDTEFAPADHDTAESMSAMAQNLGADN